MAVTYDCIRPWSVTNSAHTGALQKGNEVNIDVFFFLFQFSSN